MLKLACGGRNQGNRELLLFLFFIISLLEQFELSKLAVHKITFLSQLFFCVFSVCLLLSIFQKFIAIVHLLSSPLPFSLSLWAYEDILGCVNL